LPCFLQQILRALDCQGVHGVGFDGYRRIFVPSRDQLDRQPAGFGGPYLIDRVKDTTGSTALGLLLPAVLPLLAACLVLLGKDETTIEFGKPARATVSAADDRQGQAAEKAAASGGPRRQSARWFRKAGSSGPQSNTSLTTPPITKS
jgi:hypothetical protein